MSEILSTFVAVGFDLTGISFSHKDYLVMIMGESQLVGRITYLKDIYDLSEEEALEDIFYDIRYQERVRLLETEEEGSPTDSPWLVRIIDETGMAPELARKRADLWDIEKYVQDIRKQLPALELSDWTLFWGVERGG